MQGYQWRNEPRGLGGWLIVTLLIISLSSCAPPQSIATFAGTATITLDHGPPLFADLNGTCVRRHLLAQESAPSFLPGAAPLHQAAACSQFVTEGAALTKLSSVLSAYFSAIHQLAAFNTSNVSTIASSAAENAATAANWDSSQVSSAAKLSTLITEAFTERYQSRHLSTYLREAQQPVADILHAFEDVIGKDYLGLLREEEQTLKARYQRVGDAHSAAIILLLDRAYNQDLNELNARRQSAEAYVKALQQIEQGQAKLAENITRNSKELTMSLEPYITELESLLPEIERGLR